MQVASTPTLILSFSICVHIFLPLYNHYRSGFVKCGNSSFHLPAALYYVGLALKPPCIPLEDVVASDTFHDDNISFFGVMHISNSFASSALVYLCSNFTVIIINMLRLALIQMLVGTDKTANLKHACELIGKAVSQYKARLVCLPECFNSPYGTKHFKNYAESVLLGPTFEVMRRAAE